MAVAPKGEWIAFVDKRNARFLALPSHELSQAYVRPILIPGVDPPSLAQSTIAAVGSDLWFLHTESDFYIVLQWNPLAERTPVEIGRGRADHIGARVLVASGRAAVAVDPAEKGVGPAVELWTLTGKSLNKMTIPQPLLASALAVADDGAVLVAGYPDGTAAWGSPAFGKMSSPVTLGQKTVVAVGIHPGGRYLAFGTNDQGNPNLFLVDTKTAVVLHKFSADPDAIAALAFDASGNRLATCGGSGVIKIWDTRKLLKLQKD
ncbi:MAG: WD40 repeat domain-containing protein [Fimbriiglobus sp.]